MRAGRPRVFRVYANAEKVPPTVVSTKLTTQGLALTFSKPMDASAVQDVNNYVVKSLATASEFANGRDANPTPVAVQTAAYDPTTRTVTLILATPPDPNRDDLVLSKAIGPGTASAPTLAPGAVVLTDANGNPIDDSNGWFNVTVGRDVGSA